MNYSALALLSANTNVSCVKVIFTDILANGMPESAVKKYTYKTVLQDLQVGDFVVVEARNTFSIAKVVEVDTFINLSDNLQYRWVVSKLDLDEHKKLLEREQALINTVAKLEIKSKKESLAKALGVHEVQVLL